MSLSEKSKREQVATLQAILEIAEGLSILSNDPKALNKLITDSYALNEKEKKQFDDARVEYNKYLDKAAEVNGLLAELSAKETELKSLDKDLKEKQSALAEKEAELNKRKTKIDSLESDQRTEQSSLNERERNLEVSLKELNQDRELLASEIKKVSLLEETLKAKAEQLKVVTEGL